MRDREVVSMPVCRLSPSLRRGWAAALVLSCLALVLSSSCRRVEVSESGDTASQDAGSGDSDGSLFDTDGGDAPPDTDGGDAQPDTDGGDAPPVVLINELRSSGADGIELYNAGDTAVSLGGWLLTDDIAPGASGDAVLPEDANPWVFPGGTMLEKSGYLVSEKGSSAGLRTFGLRQGGETVTLLNGDGHIVDQVTYPFWHADISYCRLPDGGDAWQECSETLGTTNLPPDGSDPTAVLFARDHVIEVVIEIQPDHLEALRYEFLTFFHRFGGDCETGRPPTPYNWYPVNVTLDGELFEDAGMRKKGSSTTVGVGAPSFKIDLARFSSVGMFGGKSSFTFNTGALREPYVNECLSYDVFARAGVPAPRCAPVHVTANGEDWGLYSYVETMNRSLFGVHFPDNSGDHYESGVSDFAPGWDGTFEPKGNETDDRSAIEAVTAALQVADDALLESVGELVDLDAFYRFWVATVLVGHEDSYVVTRNNFHIYLDPESGRFFFLPWSLDGLLIDGPWDHSEFYSASVLFSGGLLTSRLYAHPEGQQRYFDTLDQMLTEVWDETALVAELESMAALVQPLAPEGAPFQEGVDGVRAYIEGRRAEIEAELAAGPPEPFPWSAQWPMPCLFEWASVEGTFSTGWDSLGDAPPTSEADAQLTWSNEQPSTFDGTAMAGPWDLGFELPPVVLDYSPWALVFMDLAQADGGTLGVEIRFPAEDLVPGTSLTIEDHAREGEILSPARVTASVEYVPPGDEIPTLFGSGSVELAAASAVPGEALSGSMQLTLWQFGPAP